MEDLLETVQNKKSPNYKNDLVKDNKAFMKT